ncbi:MAG: dTDP-4-dehydrorhamnose 3,5-epimerase [Gemmatimonadota bacterium]|nr:dTDP-4-dehydrorhamnose 3,5-epimerase [Gemmatimonadota bacterium]
MPEAVQIDDPAGPILFERTVHTDERGAFVEDFHEERYRALGFEARFVQTNRSSSRCGVLRGLHFQNPGAQGKLVSVTRGTVFDVAVDIRVGSPTFGHWFGVELSGENGLQLWVPPDFAHGFVALSDQADLLYHCTATYDAGAEHTLVWNDPSLAVDWPLDAPVLSPKDREGLTLEELAATGQLPEWEDSQRADRVVAWLASLDAATGG